MNPLSISGLPDAALDDATEVLPGGPLADATEVLPQAPLPEATEVLPALGDDATVVLPQGASGELGSPQASEPEADLIDLNTPPSAGIVQAAQQPALSDGCSGGGPEEEEPTGELDVTAQMPAVSDLAAIAAAEEDNTAHEDGRSEGLESPGGDATGEITAQLPSISQFADPNPWSVLKNALSESSFGGATTASEGMSAEAEPTGDIADITSQLPSLSHLAQQSIDA